MVCGVNTFEKLDVTPCTAQREQDHGMEAVAAKWLNYVGTKFLKLSHNYHHWRRLNLSGLLSHGPAPCFSLALLCRE